MGNDRKGGVKVKPEKKEKQKERQRKGFFFAPAESKRETPQAKREIRGEKRMESRKRKRAGKRNPPRISNTEGPVDTPSQEP